MGFPGRRRKRRSSAIQSFRSGMVGTHSGGGWRLTCIDLE